MGKSRRISQLGREDSSQVNQLVNDIISGEWNYNSEFYNRLFDNINELSDTVLQKVVSDFDNRFTLVHHYKRDGENYRADPDRDYYLDKDWLGNPFEVGSDVEMREVATTPRKMEGSTQMSKSFENLQNIRQIAETALRERGVPVTDGQLNTVEEYHTSANTDFYYVRDANGQIMYTMESVDEGVPVIVRDYREL